MFLSLTLLLSCLTSTAYSSAKINPNPDTVDSLDVGSYLGLWYQMAADKLVLSTTEKDVFCATALYGDNGDGTISVHNYAKIGSAQDGTVYTIDGYGYQDKPDTEPGQLKVVLISPDAAPVPAPYWILELGPKNSDGLYDYAIVSDSFSLSLFVLARDPATFNKQYKAQVSASLKKLGFTGASAPIDIYQGSDCVYESVDNTKNNLKLHPNPATVPSLDVPKYLGLWYQMSADKIVYSTFEKDAYCCTALYGDNGNGTLSVHNYARVGGPNGTVYVIDGYAYQTRPDTKPGQLKVVFNSAEAAPFPAPYWILELGPINSDGLYDYAIVSDSLSLFLFVLARDVAVFNTEYKAQVSATLTKLGFVGKTAPIDTYQNTDCVYEN